MEGHAAMDMSIPAGEASFLWRRLRSAEGFTVVSHIFIMEWAAVLRDIVVGMLLTGAVGAWVPDRFLAPSLPVRASLAGQNLGTADRPACWPCSPSCARSATFPSPASSGRAGSASVGSSAFVFADLIILPILNIYRKYYGDQDGPVYCRHLLRHHGRGRLRHRGGSSLRSAPTLPSPHDRAAKVVDASVRGTTPPS